MTRSNLDRWEDCGEALQGTSLAQLRSNVLDFSRLSLYGSEVSMAHIAKYKAASCAICSLTTAAMHPVWVGRTSTRPGTKGNYTLGLDDRDGKVRAMNGIEPNWATVEGRIEGP